MTALIHCIYASAATRDFSDAELDGLLATSRPANSGRDITGMLVYSEGSFFQVLEGEASNVDSVFARIGADPRHDRVTLVIREPIAKRAFSEWSMGFERLERDEIAAVDGLNDFFSDQTCLADIDAGRARKLLATFAAGRWRSATRSASTGASRS